MRCGLSFRPDVSLIWPDVEEPGLDHQVLYLRPRRTGTTLQYRAMRSRSEGHVREKSCLTYSGLTYPHT